MIKEVKLNDFYIGKDKLFIIAGPCVIEENLDITFRTAEALKEITSELDIPFVFKSSYDKANRTSIDSFRGVGMDRGLEILNEVKTRFEVPIITDIHESHDAAAAAEVADILQIPAFLCRQTDLLVAAAQTGKIVNIKKGQFLDPRQIKYSATKVVESGNENVLITERGTTFGYGNLVTDMRSIPIIHDIGYPVIMDATHSVQMPGGSGGTTSGERRFASTLAKAAVASGADGVFFEVHPDPDNAPCDGPNMIELHKAKDLLKTLKEIYNVVNQ